MTVGKRTQRSQTFKQFQLQSQSQQISQCASKSTGDVLPPPIFDFSMGDPAFYYLYESLKAVLLYLQATGSPISSTMLNIMHQVDQMAFNNTRLLMDLIKYQLPPFIKTPTQLQDNPSSVVPPVVSITIPDNNSVSTSCAVDEIQVSSLLAQVENIATLHELHLSTVEQQCRSIMAVCENHNLQLASQLQQSQLDLQLLESKNTELTIELILLGEENQQLLKDRPVTPKLRITRSNNNAGAYKEIQITPVHIEPSFP